MGGRYYDKAFKEMPDEFEGFELLLDRAEGCAKEDGVQLRKFSNTAYRWMLLARGFVDKGGRIPKFERA